MKFILAFELAGLPKTTNGSHGNRFAAAAERRKWRLACRMVAYFRRPPAPLTKVKLTLTRCSSGKTDFDNRVISFKPIVDGLRDALVIADDTDDVIVERLYLWERAGKNKGCVKILVESLEDDG